jgi:hypothetical protein
MDSAERYRKLVSEFHAKASEFRAKADEADNVRTAAEWDHLAWRYLRLADHAEQNSEAVR